MKKYFIKICNNKMTNRESYDVFYILNSESDVINMNSFIENKLIGVDIKKSFSLIFKKIKKFFNFDLKNNKKKLSKDIIKILSILDYKKYGKVFKRLANAFKKKKIEIDIFFKILLLIKKRKFKSAREEIKILTLDSDKIERFLNFFIDVYIFSIKKFIKNDPKISEEVKQIILDSKNKNEEMFHLFFKISIDKGTFVLSKIINNFEKFQCLHQTSLKEKNKIKKFGSLRSTSIENPLIYIINELKKGAEKNQLFNINDDAILLYNFFKKNLPLNKKC